MGRRGAAERTVLRRRRKVPRRASRVMSMGVECVGVAASDGVWREDREDEEEVVVLLVVVDGRGVERRECSCAE